MNKYVGIKTRFHAAMFCGKEITALNGTTLFTDFISNYFFIGQYQWPKTLSTDVWTLQWMPQISEKKENFFPRISYAHFRNDADNFVC